MADILIRGMEMPNNVFDCPLNSFGTCNLAQDETHCDCMRDSRPEWCPLIPLPAGHGRLGDLDRLFEVIGQDADRWIVDEVSMIETDDVLDAIQKAPTLVPAEGGNADDSKL